MLKRLKIRLLTWVVKDLFNGLMADDVFKVFGKELYMNGEKVSREEAAIYRDQAAKIKNMETWKMVTRQNQYAANRKMYETSKTVDDMVFGKAMLYNLDLLDQYLELLSKIKT